MTLIDTSAWIEFLRRAGDPHVKSRVAAYLELGTAAYCGPVAFELLTGARPAEMDDLNEALSLATLLDFPLKCWRRAATLETSLRARGVTVPRDDVFVAAASLHGGVPLYTCDPNFALMRDRGAVPLQLA